MCTVWHVDKYKITFKLFIKSRRIPRGPVLEEHWSRELSFCFADRASQYNLSN